MGRFQVRAWIAGVLLFGVSFGGCAAEAGSGTSQSGIRPSISPTSLPELDPSKCWLPGVSEPGCPDLISVRGREPAGASDSTVAGAVRVGSDTGVMNGTLIIFVSMSVCRQWSISLRTAGDVWYPTYVAGTAAGCIVDSDSPGDTPGDATAGKQTEEPHEWVVGLITNPFEVTVLNDGNIRFASLDDPAFIDFQWAR